MDKNPLRDNINAVNRSLNHIDDLFPEQCVSPIVNDVHAVHNRKMLNIVSQSSQADSRNNEHPLHFRSVQVNLRNPELGKSTDSAKQLIHMMKR